MVHAQHRHQLQQLYSYMYTFTQRHPGSILFVFVCTLLFITNTPLIKFLNIIRVLATGSMLKLETHRNSTMKACILCQFLLWARHTDYMQYRNTRMKVILYCFIKCANVSSIKHNPKIKSILTVLIKIFLKIDIFLPHCGITDVCASSLVNTL